MTDAKIWDFADVAVREKIEHERQHERRNNVYDILNQTIVIHTMIEGSFTDDKTQQEKKYIDVGYVLASNGQEPKTFRTRSIVLTHQIGDAQKLGLLPLRCKILKKKDYFTLA